MLAAHVQQEVQRQTATEAHDAQVILARGQLELLGLCELDGPVVTLLGLGRRRTAEVDGLGQTQLLAALLHIAVIKAKGVVPADDVGVLVQDTVEEGVQHISLRLAAEEGGVRVIRLVHGAKYEHIAVGRRHQVVGHPERHANLDDRVLDCHRELLPYEWADLQVVRRYLEGDGCV